MNLLGLVQALARESGTLDERQIVTVTDATGRIAKMVAWIKAAHSEVCTSRQDWLFLQGEFEGDTIAGIQRYTPAAWNLTRLASWGTTQDPGDDMFSAYPIAAGAGEEGPLCFIPWNRFYVSFTRGAQQPAPPKFFSIAPSGEFCLAPTPDGAYRVRGVYRKTPKPLAADGDVPEIPERFHMVIVYQALMKVAGHDEALFMRQNQEIEFRSLRSDMLRDCLPVMTYGGGPLA